MERGLVRVMLLLLVMLMLNVGQRRWTPDGPE
jgi:hypothetical protein